MEIGEEILFPFFFRKMLMSAFLLRFKANYLEKMRGQPHFSLWIPIAFAKIYFFCMVPILTQKPPYLVGTVLSSISYLCKLKIEKLIEDTTFYGRFYHFFSSRGVFYGFPKVHNCSCVSCLLFISSVNIYNHNRCGFIPCKYTAAHLHKAVHRE